jgi:hypothetical protein
MGAQGCTGELLVSFGERESGFFLGVGCLGSGGDDGWMQMQTGETRHIVV